MPESIFLETIKLLQFNGRMKYLEPNYIDVHIGKQIKLMRKAVKMSQGTLAQCLNITYQQIQKYENGSNKISASKLFLLSKVFDRSIAWFFVGIDVRNE